MSDSLTSHTNKTLLGVAAAVVAVGVSAAVLSRSKPEKKEETWEDHVNEKHGSLQEIYKDTLYLLEAPGCDMGPPIRNMVIYRVPDKKKKTQHRLMIISAIAVRDDTLQEILELGEPSVLVVPNHMHRCCAAVWKKRFPAMNVVCVGASVPKNSRDKIEAIVKVDTTTEELSQEAEWKDVLAVKQIDGWAHFEEILELKLSDTKKAMVVCDLLFTMPYDKNCSLFEKTIMWFFDSNIVLPEEGNMVIPKVSRVGRMFGVLDWKKAEAWYRTYAQEHGKSIYAILVGHGVPVVELDPEQGCTEALLGVADQLVKPRW